ncbi:MAG: hypothetical protein PHC66_01895 [Candidatus Nanoarchaeia archaeon]|nr:hypothetical protein [Candidatus Nanoarchaeia archaeon]MDD5239040.1 hypothetical protein [Candidatus Nanoarchaeia archaeon]
MVSKLGLTILASIVMTIIFVALVNVGTSIFIEEPRYDTYCKPIAVESKTDAENQAYWDSCNKAYEDAMKPYNQMRFYIFAPIGFILLLVGLLLSENFIRITGLATGAILVMEGVATNFQDKIAVFVTLLIILAVFGIVAWRIIKKMKK